LIALTTDTFSHAHIAATAATTGVLCAGVTVGCLTGRHRLPEAAAVGTIAGLVIYLWRASANMPQLNNDGISGFSANDWLAPVITFVALSIYADLRTPTNPKRFGHIRAAATIIAFAVNVITI